jgi:hypothetical protein
MPINLKISKTMQAIIMPGEQGGAPYAGLSGVDTIRDLIRQQYGIHAIAKDGAVYIDVSDIEAHMLAEHAKLARTDLEQRIAECKTDEEKKPFFGRNSTWSALLRNIEKECAKTPA